jgi:hypothetical protein
VHHILMQDNAQGCKTQSHDYKIHFHDYKIQSHDYKTQFHENWTIKLGNFNSFIIYNRRNMRLKEFSGKGCSFDLYLKN